MTPLQFSRSVRSLNRLRQIAVVLTQHGFGHVVQRLQLTRYLPVWMVPKAARLPHADDAGSLIGRRMTRACADLGPTFVKFGQTLTTRPDLLPPEVLDELKSLQDQVPPFDTDEAVKIIEADLGAPVSQSFQSLERTPIASGSIGQVYRAVSAAGEPLIVKVLRPGIEELVRLDMHLLKGLAESIERYLPELRIYHPVMLIEEFERTLLSELDFINEASTTARFHEAFADTPFIHVPKIHWELCSTRVLTMEALAGANVDMLMSGASPGVDAPAVARRLADAYFRQFFELGTFQADPHPGNILIEPPARVGLIDFGQVGVITDELMTQFVVMVYAGVYKEPEIIVDTLADMGAFDADTDPHRMERDVRSLLDKYYGLPIKRVDLGVLLEEFSDVMRRHRVTIPREMVMVIKALATVAGVIERLDPELDLVVLLQPRLQALARERFSPRRLGRAATVTGWHLLSALRHAPRQVRRWLRRLAAGQWQLNLRHENIDRLTTELDRSSNRLAFSIVIAAIIVGSSVVVSTNTELTLFDVRLQYLGLVGYILAAVLGLGLVWAIFRSGRLH